MCNGFTGYNGTCIVLLEAVMDSVGLGHLLLVAC